MIWGQKKGYKHWAIQQDRKDLEEQVAVSQREDEYPSTVGTVTLGGYSGILCICFN